MQKQIEFRRAKFEWIGWKVQSELWTLRPAATLSEFWGVWCPFPAASTFFGLSWIQLSLAASVATCIHMCACPCVGDWVHMWLLCPQCHRIKIRDSGANTVRINQVFIQFNLKSILWIEFTSIWDKINPDCIQFKVWCERRDWQRYCLRHLPNVWQLSKISELNQNLDLIGI